MTIPPLGYIEPHLRSNEQNDAHVRALAAMPKFAVPGFVDPGPVKVMLTDVWKHSKVVADIKQPFTGFYQFTGSCVGVSAGNAIATLGFTQRLVSANPTLAFIPFWPFSYGRTRYNEGDRGQGEGAVDSVMAKTLCTEGIVSSENPGLPQYHFTADGIQLSKSLEMQYSDGAAPCVTSLLSIGVAHTLGTAAPINSTQEIRQAIINGYPVLDGCSMFCQSGSIRGEGTNAYVRGKYDGRGGHSTCFLGVWDHPNDGLLFLYSNQWPTSTYPTDPAGAGRCCVWLPESEVSKLFSQYGGGNGETVALSHLNWFPAQPDVPNIVTPWIW